MIAKAKSVTAVLLARYSPRPIRTERDRKWYERDQMLNSCDKQIEQLRARAAQRGYLVDETLIFTEDAVSGGSELNKRAVMQAAVEAACRRGRILMVRDIERLGRSLETFSMICRLQRKKAGLETIDEGLIDLNNPHQLGWIGMRIINGIVYRLTSAKRTRDGSRSNQADGRRMSDIVPFGYVADPKDAKQIVPLDEEQAIVDRIKELQREQISFRAIGRTLDAEGLSCRGRKWNHKTIARILEREALRASAGAGWPRR